MNRPPLQFVHSQPSLDPDREGALVWEGASMRVVHRQRARKLRRRGVEVIDTGERTRTGRKVSAWFVDAPVTQS